MNTNYLRFVSLQLHLEFKQQYLKLPIQEIPHIYFGVNWIDVINWNLHGIHEVNENETVIFSDPLYLFKLQFIMTKRTTANYLAWRLIRRSKEFLSPNVYQRYQQFDSNLRGTTIKTNSRTIDCVEYAMEL